MTKFEDDTWNDDEDVGSEDSVPEEEEFSELVDRDFADRYSKPFKTWNPD